MSHPRFPSPFQMASHVLFYLTFLSAPRAPPTSSSDLRSSSPVPITHYHILHFMVNSIAWVADHLPLRTPGPQTGMHERRQKQRSASERLLRVGVRRAIGDACLGRCAAPPEISFGLWGGGSARVV